VAGAALEGRSTSCPFADPAASEHPGIVATVGAVWLFFSNPAAVLVLFMGYRFLNQ